MATFKTCSKCEIEKDITSFGLDKGKPRPSCKTCMNRKKKDRYKALKTDEITTLKKKIKTQNEELFLKTELIKKMSKALKSNNLDVPTLNSSDETHMYQFLYC